jgi:hypothetical protein
VEIALGEIVTEINSELSEPGLIGILRSRNLGYSTIKTVEGEVRIPTHAVRKATPQEALMYKGMLKVDTEFLSKDPYNQNEGVGYATQVKILQYNKSRIMISDESFDAQLTEKELDLIISFISCCLTNFKTTEDHKSALKRTLAKMIPHITEEVNSDLIESLYNKNNA